MLSECIKFNCATIMAVNECLNAVIFCLFCAQIPMFLCLRWLLLSPLGTWEYIFFFVTNWQKYFAVPCLR